MSDASSSSQGTTFYLTVLDDKAANGTGLSMHKLDANMTDQQTFVADHHGGLHSVAAPDYLLSRKGNFHGAQGCRDGDGLHLWEDKRGGPNGGNQRWLVQEEHLVLEGTQLAASIHPDVAGGVCLRQSKEALTLRLRYYDYDESIPRIALTWTQPAQEMQGNQSPQGASPAAAESFSEPRHQQEGVQTTFWTVICTFFHKILQNHCFFQCLYYSVFLQILY